MNSILKAFRIMPKSSRMLRFPKKYKVKLSTINFAQFKHMSNTYAKHPARSTIFALSTPSGMSAIAVIRISGPNASDVLYKMGKFTKLPEARKAVLCGIRDPVSAELLDKALVLWFPSPNSFTGEDMCELHVHGGIAVIKSVLQALPKLHQFRMAEPGEFTKRAFMASKLDLTEVEGIADLLHAETEIQQKQALRQMEGVLNKLYNDWSLRIKKCLASVEAFIDFSEDQHLDDAILETVQSDLKKLEEEMRGFVSDYRRGERLKNGIHTVLIGRPNVGKSSLLNNLCQRDIAIVSPVAGTTRDIIETSFNLAGYLVNISDTAGIRETTDLVELEGVNRAKKRSTNADLMLFIVEAKKVLKIINSCSIPKEYFINHLLKSELGEYFIKETKFFNLEERNKLDNADSNNVIVLVNKIDLLNEDEKAKVKELEDTYSSLCAISCTEGLGFNKFLNLFTDIVKEMCCGYKAEEPIITRERHRVYISNCLQHIISYNDYVNIDIAIAAEKLRNAMNELGKITGKVRVDDILDVVFKDFCIGK